MSQSHAGTVSNDEVGEFPFWMRLGDDPWCGEVNDPPHEFILVDGREVLVEQSLARGVLIVDLKFWGSWVLLFGWLAIPFIGLGWLRQHQITMQIFHLELLPCSNPAFVVRLKGTEILRTTEFELARNQIRLEIEKR